MLRGVLVWLRTGQMIPHKRHEFFIGGIQGRPPPTAVNSMPWRVAEPRTVMLPESICPPSASIAAVICSRLPYSLIMRTPRI